MDGVLGEMWYDAFGPTDHTKYGSAPKSGARTSPMPTGYLNRPIPAGFQDGYRRPGTLAKRAGAVGAAGMAGALLNNALADDQHKGFDGGDMLASVLPMIGAGVAKTRRGMGWMTALPIAAQLALQLWNSRDQHDPYDVNPETGMLYGFPQ